MLFLIRASSVGTVGHSVTESVNGEEAVKVKELAILKLGEVLSKYGFAEGMPQYKNVLH